MELTADALWQLWMRTGYGARGAILLGGINFIVWCLCHWDNLRHGRGVDRLTWLLALPVPLIGCAAYLLIALPERDQIKARDNEEPEDWRRSLR